MQLAEGATTDGASVVEQPRPTSPATSCPRRSCSWTHPALALGQGRLPLGGRDGRQGRLGGLTVAAAGPRVVTARLVLRPFTDVDRAPFAELERASPRRRVLGESPSRAESDAVVDRFSEEMAREGWGPWAVEVTGGAPFVGMVGLHRVNPALPCAPAVEVGWRLHPDHWGARLRHRGGGGLAALRLRGGGPARDCRLHDDAEHPLPGGHGAASAWCATPGATSTTRGRPRAARCGATCSTGPPGHTRAPTVAP